MRIAAVFLVISAGGLAAASVARAADVAPRARISLDGEWTFRHANRDKFYPAEVPGVVHLDLLRNELIAEPFYGTHETAL
ncbi:MAG: hypothetical protein OES47_10740, partial [Acidobacteriota bacterium]|nr:hypothetical protein [Acidobacteriota bacterium]